MADEEMGSVYVKMGLKSTVPLDIAQVKTELKGVEAAEESLEKKTDVVTSQMAADFQRVGDSAKALGKSLTLYVTTPILAIAAASIYAAGNAAETQSKFEQVYGTLSEDVQSWADNFGNAVGRSTTDLQDMLATMGSIVKAMGITDEAGAEFSETITQLAVDMASFNNTADSEAFTALRSAITGEYEALKKYGIVVNQAKVEQELLNMGLEGGVKAATDEEKAQARLNIILRATSDAQGDAERTAGSFANQMKALEADVKEAAESLGAELLPAAQSIIGVARQMIRGFEELDDTTQSVILVTGGFAAALGPTIWLSGTMISSIGKLRLAMDYYKASTFAATAATKGFSVALATTPVGLVAIAVTGLVTGLGILTYTMGDAKDEADQLTNSLDSVGDVSGYTGDQLRDLADEIRNGADLTHELFIELENVNKYGGISEETIKQTEAWNQSINDLKADAYEAMAVVADAMDAARDAVREADEDYQNHKQTISDLTDEYDDLYRAVNDLVEEISDQELTIESADIALEEARIAQEEVYADPEATDLEKRKADLRVKQAIDRQEDANKKLIELEAEKNETLDGMSIDQAKVQLDNLQKQISDEETALKESYNRKEVLQAAYNAIEIQNLEETGNTMMDKWSDVVKFFEDNPAVADVSVEWQSGALESAFKTLAGVNVATEQAATTAASPVTTYNASSSYSEDNSMVIENMVFNNSTDVGDFWKARGEQLKLNRIQRGIRSV